MKSFATSRWNKDLLKEFPKLEPVSAILNLCMFIPEDGRIGKLITPGRVAPWRSSSLIMEFVCTAVHSWDLGVTVKDTCILYRSHLKFSFYLCTLQILKLKCALCQS